MQKCSPKPNARCGFGLRSTRKANGSSNTSSSRFADAKYSANCSPAEIFTPRISQSSVATRVKWLIGLTQRRISSAALGNSSGRSRSRSHSAGCSQKASNPPLMAFRVVSFPASTNSSQYGHELLVRERLAVDPAAEQLAHQIVFRFAPTLFDQALEIGVQLPARPLDRLARASRPAGGTRDRPFRSPRWSTRNSNPSQCSALRGSTR